MVERGQDIAVIGGGVSGMAAAHFLSRNHSVALFEARDRLGGHTATVDVELEGREYQIDTGFIVCNDRTYPHFLRLMERLKVELRPTLMSFSVHCVDEDFEYNGNTLASLFVQRRNVLRPRFLRMIADIVRFNRSATADLAAGKCSPGMTLGDYLNRKRYSETFRRRYLVPMGSAIWSASEADMLRFPLALFVRFFENHGLLSVGDRPQWHTVVGGSRRYIGPLTESYASRVRLGTPVRKIVRTDAGVEVATDGGTERFDQVVLATHSDQSLEVLGDPSDSETDILGAIAYQQNDVVLHTDVSLLPRRRGAWASWNYRVHGDEGRGAREAPVSVTYNMNILQGIESRHTFCVTLNPDLEQDRIDPSTVLGRYRYAHPQFTTRSERAKAGFDRISGPAHRTHYCGAYWRNGFHEDGLWSAVRVAESMDCRLPEDG